MFLAVTAIASAATATVPLLVAHAVAQAGSISSTALLSYFVVIGGLIAIGRIMQDLKLVTMNALEQKIRVAANNRLFSCIINADLAVFSRSNSAKIANLVQSFHSSNKTFIQLYLMVFVSGLLDVVAALVVLLNYGNWIISLLILLFGAANIVVTHSGNKIGKNFLTNATQRNNEGANFLGNVIQSIISVKVFARENWVSGIYNRYAQDANDEWRKFYHYRTMFSVLLSVFGFLQYISVFAAGIFYYGLERNTTELLAVTLIIAQLNRPFEMIGSSLRDLISAKSMSQPFLDLFGATLEQEDADKNSVPLTFHRAPMIRLSDASFSHTPQAKAGFENLSVDFEPGKMNFIVGETGCGKSTLMQVLLKINKKYAGSVKIEDSELSEIDTKSLLGHVAYVPQEPIMMNLSIRDNVLLGRDFTDEEVSAALERVHLTDKLKGLKEGLEYQIGERGQLLSVGERQRLSIARALISNPQILLLDEASSALDEATELDIFQAIRKLSGGCTVIAITHRLSIISERDFVLDLGRAATSSFHDRAVVKSEAALPL